MSRPSEGYDDNLLLYTPCTEALAGCHVAAGLHDGSPGGTPACKVGRLRIPLAGPKAGTLEQSLAPTRRNAGWAGHGARRQQAGVDVHQAPRILAIDL